MLFKKKGESPKYSFLDKDCIGRTCWAPGLFQHRAPLAGGGSMNTSSLPTPCCMNRAYRGCPPGPFGERHETHEGQLVTVQGVKSPDKALAMKRKHEGWAKV